MGIWKRFKQGFTTLALSRCENEAILIGNNVRIEVLGFKGNGRSRRANLMITAPKDVHVSREEVAHKYNHAFHGYETPEGTP